MFTLTTLRYFKIVAGFAVILLTWGCGDEPIDNTRTAGEESSADAPSTIYFPMTTGNHWVYRNPGGSQWSREVVQSDIIAHDFYHSLIYNPPLAGEHPDFIKSPTYVVDPAGIVLHTRTNDMSDAVWQPVLLSQGDFSGWSRKRGFRNGVWSIRKKHNDILVSLFFPKYASQSKVILLYCIFRPITPSGEK